MNDATYCKQSYQVSAATGWTFQTGIDIADFTVKYAVSACADYATQAKASNFFISRNTGKVNWQCWIASDTADMTVVANPNVIEGWSYTGVIFKYDSNGDVDGDAEDDGIYSIDVEDDGETVAGSKL